MSSRSGQVSWPGRKKEELPSVWMRWAHTGVPLHLLASLHILYLGPARRGVCQPWEGSKGRGLEPEPKLEARAGIVNGRGEGKPTKEPRHEQDQRTWVTEAKVLSKDSGTDFPSMFR